MSHHISTPGGAAHDVDPSIAPLSVSSTSLDAAISDAAYTDEDTTDSINSFAPSPSWSCEDPHSVGPFESQEEDVRTVKQYDMRQVFSASICLHKITWHQAHSS